MIAHRRTDTGETQSIRAHSEQTAALAADFAIDELKEIARACGLLHDVGKYQPSFQRRIRGEQIHAPHALCGAIAAKAHYPNGPARRMMEYVVAGHHAGLPDYGGKADASTLPTLCGTLQRATEPFEAYREELTLPPLDAEAFDAWLRRDCRTPEDAAPKYAFVTRYVFSCLTDADSLDTEAFDQGVGREPLTADFQACLDRVNAKLNSFTCVTPLQKARARLQEQAFAQSDREADVYMLNMPTGSGKTLCSLKFALERALRGHKKRLIFIIPYNSIINQTADTFEKILGPAAAILRHQSTWIYEDDQTLNEEEKVARLKATENWDAPIVITTAVQFFESLYGDRRSRLRKLHNMQDALLIFDEAHLLPRAFLAPCLKGIALLTHVLNSEAILLTATMPDYRNLFERFGIPGLSMVDLVPDRSSFGAFQKCRYQVLGPLSAEGLLMRVARAPSCLVIVNSRKAARALYTACPAKRKYHLSTWMTSLDRERVIGEIHEALAALEARSLCPEGVPEDERIFVFSTSLVEAGVDLDFDTVYRELTGLDSILQAGGRCNREGKRPMADVYVFELEANAGATQRDARVGITREILRTFDPIDSPEAILAYYDRLFFAHEDELTSRCITRMETETYAFNPQKPTQLPFRSYAQAFQLIDAPTYAVAVPCDETSRALIARIPYGLSGKERRALQRYTCSVSPYDFRQMRERHLIEVDQSGLILLKDERAYQADTGIRFESKDIYE
jgi:CRISPR-associated endonuclease/helicase Cas3